MVNNNRGLLHADGRRQTAKYGQNLKKIGEVGESDFLDLH